MRELASALVTAADLIAEGGVSTDAVAMLSEAAARLVAVLPPPSTERRGGRGSIACTADERRGACFCRCLAPPVETQGARLRRQSEAFGRAV